MGEKIENLDPSKLMQISILKQKIDQAKGNRFSLIITAQAAQQIGNEKEVKRLQEGAADIHKEIIFYQNKLKELEKKES